MVLSQGGLLVSIGIDKPWYCQGEDIKVSELLLDERSKYSDQGTLSVTGIVAPVVTVSMVLICECRSEICQSELVDDGVDAHTRYHYYPYSTELLHTEPVLVFDARVSGGAMLSTVSAAYAAPLPKDLDLPSSLKSFKGTQYPFDVRYSLKFHIYGVDGQILSSVSNEVKVFSVNRYMNPEKPLLVMGSKTTAILCCFETNRFTFFCATDKTVYCPGDPIKLTYWIETDNAETLPRFSSLEATMTINAITYPSVGLYYGNKASHSQVFNRLVTKQVLQKPVEGTVQHDTMTLPLDCGPDFNRRSCLSWCYEIKLTLRTFRHLFDLLCGRKMKIVLPIAITGRQCLGGDEDAASGVTALPYGASDAQRSYLSNSVTAAILVDTSTQVAESYYTNGDIDQEEGAAVVEA